MKSVVDPIQITAAELEQTKNLLKRYVVLNMAAEDFKAYGELLKKTIYEGDVACRIDQEDRHADKTPNAILLAQRQREAAEECEHLKVLLEPVV